MPQNDLRKELLDLLRKVANGTASAEEAQFAATYYRQFENEPDILEGFSETEREEIGAAILAKINHRIGQLEGARVIGIQLWKKLAAVAAVLIVIAGVTWISLQKTARNTDQQTVAVIAHDIPAPVTNKATITLAGGKQIILDSLANGSLIAQGIEGARKTGEGQLVYDGTATTVTYQTLSNPRASRAIQLTLSDGSVVHLNAASSITFPTAFTGTERKVSITGEAYFEVKHNAKQPFRVQAGNQLIEDVGTSFNVNAYGDEPNVKTTLIEGEVKINNVTLRPGQQYNGTSISTPDIEQVVAWKNGLFSFAHTDLAGVLRQLEKWYDVEVVIQGRLPAWTFGGEIQRELSLAKVLRILQQQQVHFTIEGKKIIVTE